MNTYGLRSINADTFNLNYHSSCTYPQVARDVLVTLLKIHNLTLNILGYIPGVSFFSGCLRVGLGLMICAVTLAIGDPHARKGLIIGHWYDEALITGVTQIVRGALEAAGSIGHIINAALDVVATVITLSAEASNASVCCGGCRGGTHHVPYPDPDYPFPLNLLYFV